MTVQNYKVKTIVKAIEYTDANVEAIKEWVSVKNFKLVETFGSTVIVIEGTAQFGIDKTWYRIQVSKGNYIVDLGSNVFVVYDKDYFNENYELQ